MSSRKTPLQNRVAPDGGIHAVAERGTLMGNRGGRLHDQDQTLGKARWKSQAWIACTLDFKNRQRKVMANSYTELFFLDEATALAAGHRPCYECRRADAKAFAARWAEAFGLDTPPRAPRMDSILHAERLASPTLAQWSHLPDCTIVQSEGRFLMKQGHLAWLWSFSGYGKATIPSTQVQVITPPAIVAVLRAGYQPALHPSLAINAGGAISSHPAHG